MLQDEDGQRIESTSHKTVDIYPLLEDIAVFKQSDGLLTPSQFIDVCKQRGLNVEEEELEYYESRGLLYPILRIQRAVEWRSAQGFQVDIPDGVAPPPGMWRHYQSYSTDGQNLHTLQEEGLLWQPSEKPFCRWKEFRDAEAFHQDKVSTYYVLYQFLHIHWLKQQVAPRMVFRLGTSEDDSPVKGSGMPLEEVFIQDYLKDQARGLDELVALLLAIQNRYRPHAIGILSGYHKQQDYQTYIDRFSPEAAWAKVPIPLERLRTTRWLLCHQARDMDPLSEWYDLVGHVGATKRWKLRGAALLAQELYVIISMMTSFMRDLAQQHGEEEAEYTCLGNERYETQMYGRKLNYWDFDLLEKVLTAYDLNPRPKILFVVEGATEATVIPIICEAMGVRLATFGIELHDIGGASKNLEVLTRYAAPPRLGGAIKPGVYAAVRYTRLFALFDREQGWQQYDQVKRFLISWRNTVSSILPDDMPSEDKAYIAEQGVTIERWDTCFEFDNFTDEELAQAISEYASKWNWPTVDASDVANCRARFPNISLTRIIADKAREMKAAGQEVVEHRDYLWKKTEVGKILAHRLADRVRSHTNGDPPEAPIVALIERLVEMAVRSWP